MVHMKSNGNVIQTRCNRWERKYWNAKCHHWSALQHFTTGAFYFFITIYKKWIETVRILGEGPDPASFSCSITLTWGCQYLIWTSKSANSSIWTIWMHITTLLWGGNHSVPGAWMHLVSSPLFTLFGAGWFPVKRCPGNSSQQSMSIFYFYGCWHSASWMGLYKMGRLSVPVVIIFLFMRLLLETLLSWWGSK